MTDDIALVEYVLDDIHPGRRPYSELEIFDQTRPEDLWAGTDWEIDPSIAARWLDRAGRNGLSFRYVITPQIARQPRLRMLVPMFARHVQWRVLPVVPQRIFAREGLAFSSMDAADRRGKALVCQGSAASYWLSCADDLWQRAKPWSPETALRNNVRHSAVIDLLLEGFGDEAIARRLDVSVRTVRRDVADLMTEHGSRSRLQLGAALAGVGSAG